ncbi:uncharacterized protein JCM10292_000035 [Rhodotorula paludigena]|uniref:uncharacterized protein n=1 Tax=Rhodotorula paludigena TaxID=86838 RepID=UPI0031791272
MPAGRAWTADDDAQLMAALERGEGTLTWSAIAREAFPDGKFGKQDCQDRYKNLTKPKPTKGPWTVEEDDKLRELVDELGSEKWVVIAGELGTRTGKQCRERWHNHLDPSINKSDWTPEEDAKLHELHAALGPKWAEISKHLPGRPDNTIKNYWNAQQARAKREQNKSLSITTSATSADKVQAAKAKAAAAAAAASAAAQSKRGEPATPAPAMDRSASSTSLSSARFAPYARSSPMSKSRSESVSSLGGFNPLRASTSVEQFEAPAPGPTRRHVPSSSLSMTRSHSMATVSPREPRHLSHHEISREQLLALGAVDPDEQEVLAGYSTAPPPATPSRFRRPHANSSPPVPMGLQSWTYPSTAPLASRTSPQSSQSPFQPMPQPYEVTDAWSEHPAVQGSIVTPSGRVQPVLTRLRIDGDSPHSSVTAPSPYDDAPSGSTSAYYTTPGTDSRFASPAEPYDPAQHAFFGAGPISFDPSQLQAPLAPYAIQTSQPAAVLDPAAGVPYIHPAHLATLDESQAYPGQSGLDVSDYAIASQSTTPGAYTPVSGSSAATPSPLDTTGLAYQVPPPDVQAGYYSSNASPAGSGIELYGGSASSTPAPSMGSPFDSSAHSLGGNESQLPMPFPVTLDQLPSPPQIIEGTAPRPNLARRDTAPATIAFPVDSRPLSHRPSPLHFAPTSLSASSTPNPHSMHRHSPSLPTTATPTSYGFDLATPLASKMSHALPPSASFPGRPSSLSFSAGSGTGARHPGGGHTRHRSLSRPTPYSIPSSSSTASLASLRSGPAGGLAAPFDPPPGAAAPPLSRSGSVAGLASEPMSKVYSSGVSEIAGRWEGLSLASPSGGSPAPPLAAAGSNDAAWLPRSAGAASLGALVAEEGARLAARAGQQMQSAHPTTGLMSVDEHGRATLPL